jgi:hypothetical protein
MMSKRVCGLNTGHPSTGEGRAENGRARRAGRASFVNLILILELPFLGILRWLLVCLATLNLMRLASPSAIASAGCDQIA